MQPRQPRNVQQRDRAVVVVCDPDAAAANRDPARAVTDRDRLANSSCRRIDARHRVGERVRDPHRIVAERDARRSGIDSDLITQPVAVRVAVATTTRAPCNWLRTPASPPCKLFCDSDAIEKGMSAMRADGGADEL